MVASPSPVILCSQAFCSRSPRAAARSIPPGRHFAVARRIQTGRIRGSARCTAERLARWLPDALPVRQRHLVGRRTDFFRSEQLGVSL
jgi:hypothetical protein